jgi:Ser/Thr protein kinase RdoA (MazF antagonist)
MVMGGTRAADDVWAVGKDYVLKVGEREKFLRGFLVASALAAQGFLAATPMTTRQGEWLACGEPAFALARRLEGEPLKTAKRFGEGREEYGLQYGQGLARLHRALASVEAAIRPAEEDLPKQLLGWALPALRLQNEQWKMGLGEAFFEKLLRELSETLPHLPKQLIHRDPHPGNILFEGEKLSGFIDFELSVRGIRLWDPCYCATGILSEAEDLPSAERGWIELLRGILRGYHGLNPLIEAERRAVFPVLCAIQAICIAFFESREDFKALAKKNREILRFIASAEERIREIPF